MKDIELILQIIRQKRLGIIEVYRGNYDVAIKYLTEVYNSNPKDAVILFYLARAYFMKKNLNEALATINKCLSIKPGNYKAEILKKNIKKAIDASK